VNTVDFTAQYAYVNTVHMTEPAKPRYHHGNLSSALLDSALQLVATDGVEGFSLRAAARAAGVNPAAVYRHFADRSELLGAVAAVGFGELGARMAAAVAAADDARTQFVAAGEAYIRFALDQPEYFRVMFGPYGSRPGSRARRDLEADPERASAYGVLLGVVGDLVPREPDDSALTAWSAVHGLATLLVDHAVELDAEGIEAAIAHLLQTTLRGLG
jgi:AcrR family transcriptional regulator